MAEANDNTQGPVGTEPVPPAFSVARLTNSSESLDGLAALLVRTVAEGGSVSFMHPLSFDSARGFWEAALAAAARDERIVLGAFDGDTLVGTVTLLLAFPENQPHRCEIAKMMTHPAHRNQGVATLLLREAERLAVDHGKTLVVLDTAFDGGAAAFYERHGYTQAGTIPDFALKPHGGLTATLLYWKRLAPKAIAGPPGLVGTVRTTWPDIRFALFRREDGGFEFYQQHVSDQPGRWINGRGSGVYGDLESARDDMMRAAEDFEDS